MILFLVPNTFECLTEMSNLFLNNNLMKQVLLLSPFYKPELGHRVLSKRT